MTHVPEPDCASASASASEICCICYGNFADLEYKDNICIIKHDTDNSIADSKKRKHYIHKHCSTQWSKMTNGIRLCPLDRDKIKSLYTIPLYKLTGLDLSQYPDFSVIISTITLSDDILHSISNINSADSHGKTLLYHSCELGKDLIVKKLLKYGADPNIGNKQKFTPLMIAICKNFLNIVKLLCTKITDFNTVDSKGWTALEYAVLNRRMQIINTILDTGKVSKRQVTVIITMHQKSILKDTLYGKDILDKLFAYCKTS